MARPPGLSMTINPDRCNGCVVCLRACPTKAVRLREGFPVILTDLCVDCGACIRACPRRAIRPNVTTYQDAARFKVKAVLPSRVIYTQFGDDVLPNDILLALTRMGFDYVFDGAVFCEWSSVAVADWLERNPEVSPAISSVCPVVKRLIAQRFPELIPNLVPLAPPREAGARYIRRLIRKKTGLPDEDIGVFHITHCAAKITAANAPPPNQKSSLDGSFGLHDLFGHVLRNLKKLTDEDHETQLFKAGGCGISWELAGFEAVKLVPPGKTLSVTGLTDTLEVLEQVSSGRLAGVRYLECNACPDGCLGGPLTVDNPYMARATLRHLVHMFGDLPRVRPNFIRRLMSEGIFEPLDRIRPTLAPLDGNPLEAMRKLKKMDELTARLPGLLCGVCGAPDCRTLAEDVVLGAAELSDCPFLNEEEPKEPR